MTTLLRYAGVALFSYNLGAGAARAAVSCFIVWAVLELSVFGARAHERRQKPRGGVTVMSGSPYERQVWPANVTEFPPSKGDYKDLPWNVEDVR